MMGGTIRMESALDVGTTMSFDLTLAVASPKEVALLKPVSAQDWLSQYPHRSAPDTAQAEAEGTLVLLADDHPMNRMLMARQVNMLGYAAESAEDGVQALAMWRTGRFGLLITDGNMPMMDGYELAQNIRRIEAERGNGSRIPIVACTANVLGREAEHCIEAGMDDYLAKPTDLQALARKLHRWLPIPSAE